MSLAQKAFFSGSLPTFASLKVYEGVKKMVADYPPDDEEVVRRGWLGILYSRQRHKDVRVAPSGRLGEGLFAAETIPEGAVIGEYTGLVKKRRLLVSMRKDYVGEYTVPGYPVKYIIDAEHYGSLMRFINHSDEPNTFAITVIFEGLLRVYIVAKKEILPGSQLFLDYGPAYWRFRSKY